MINIIYKFINVEIALLLVAILTHILKLIKNKIKIKKTKKIYNAFLKEKKAKELQELLNYKKEQEMLQKKQKQYLQILSVKKWALEL